MTSSEASIEESLEPGIDIDLGTQRKILALEQILSSADHYQLLGVRYEAEKKEIKSAYFALMNELHTDKFYGKNLGTFRPRLQRIIEALTKANDTLGKKRTRQEYDEYLASRNRTLGARTSVAPTGSQLPGRPGSSIPPDRRAPRTAVAPIDVVRIPGAPRTPHIAGPDSGSFAPSGSTPPPSEVSRPKVPPPSDARRKRLARKMGVRPTPKSSSGPSNADAGQRRTAVKADLRARYDARKNKESDNVEKYLTSARDARASANWSAAVNAMRIAVSMRPSDPDLQRELDAIQDDADEALAPHFLEQARYEEKDGRPERAARSYERAGRGKKSPELFNKGAECLLSVQNLEEDDQRKAVELARQAVALDKEKALYRITLAKAYDTAGMKTSALGEAGRALELEPDNDEAKELQKRLR